MLGWAAFVIGVGFLITGVGLFLQVPYAHDASTWSEAVSFLVLSVGAGYAAAAFLRRLEQGHSSYLSGLPNPG
jgi:membrane protein implicated in regulation of membrane protease activity